MQRSTEETGRKEGPFVTISWDIWQVTTCNLLFADYTGYWEEQNNLNHATWLMYQAVNRMAQMCLTKFCTTCNVSLLFLHYITEPYEGWSTRNEKNVVECFYAHIHYICWIAYFFRTLHENTLACDVILVARQHISNVLSFSSTVYVFTLYMGRQN